jgi:hypothetical protein
LAFLAEERCEIRIVQDLIHGGQQAVEVGFGSGSHENIIPRKQAVSEVSSEASFEIPSEARDHYCHDSDEVNRDALTVAVFLP